MARFGRFLILALIGFGLGAGLAWFQQREQAPPAFPTTVAQQKPAAATAAITPATKDAAAGAAMTAPAPQQAVGPFALTDDTGAPVTDKSFGGKMLLVYFGYTQSPDLAPAMLDKISAAMRGLGALADHVQPLFITMDPAHDTAPVLKTFLAAYPGILGLTGTAVQVQAAESTYKVTPFAPAADAKAMAATLSANDGLYLVSGDQVLARFSEIDTAESIISGIKAHIAMPIAMPIAQPPAAAPTTQPPAAMPTTQPPAAMNKPAAPTAPVMPAAPAPEAQTAPPANTQPAAPSDSAPSDSAMVPAPSIEAAPAAPALEGAPAMPAPDKTKTP